jgi:hypothetical protein
VAFAKAKPEPRGPGMSRVGVVEEPWVRRSRKRELSVSACCSNNIGDRIPPSSIARSGPRLSPQNAGVPFRGSVDSCRHESRRKAPLKIITTLRVVLGARRLLSPPLRFVEPTRPLRVSITRNRESKGEANREETLNSNSGSHHRVPAENRGIAMRYATNSRARPSFPCGPP